MTNPPCFTPTGSPLGGSNSSLLPKKRVPGALFKGIKGYEGHPLALNIKVVMSKVVFSGLVISGGSLHGGEVLR